jgi:hypothetical protein
MNNVIDCLHIIFVEPWVALMGFFAPQRFADRRTALAYVICVLLYLPGVALMFLAVVVLGGYGLAHDAWRSWRARRKDPAP